MQNINIDSFDLIYATALIGGFATGNWVPVILLTGLTLLTSGRNLPQGS